MEAPKALGKLLVLRKLLAPIISKRIEKIESLAISNCMSSLKFEIDQIPLHIKEQEGIANDDNSFLRDLHQILQLFEGFIDERVLHLSIPALDAPAQKEPYPKVDALLRLNTRQSNESTSSDLSQLLLLPETVEKSIEAQQLLTDFNAKNSEIVNAASRQDVSAINLVNDNYPSGVSISKTGPEPNALNQSRECLTHLVDALVKNIQTSECHFPHIAKLQVRDPVISGDSSNEFQHKMFVSCCKVEEKWQETICHVVPHLPELKIVGSFCNAIHKSVEDHKILELFVHAQASHIRQGTKTNIIRYPPVSPTVSLKNILDDEKPRFLPAQTVILGLNLCHALLRMYKSGMQSKDWTAENIFFLFDPDGGYIREAYNPYFAISLLQGSGSNNAEEANPRRFPVLVNFAKLLLEIASGERIFNHPYLPLDVYLLTYIPENEGSKVSDYMVADYVDAARACLIAEKPRSGDDDYDEKKVLNEEDQCRAVLLKAAEDLEKARQWHKPPKNLNEPLELRFSRPVPGGGHKEQQNHQNGKSPLVSSLDAPSNNRTNMQPALRATSQDTVDREHPAQLFDEWRGRFIGGDDRLYFAVEFLSLADKFYTGHISDLSNERKIRIAILDTGIDESNTFFRGVLCTRRERDDPVKEKKSFVGAPNECGDTFGHGTNVAHLILKIAPEADLYIAKISDGGQNEGGRPVLEAIRWARSLKVDIINMSFAFLNDHTDIRQAIEDAENDGIIPFAAASNCGGNGSRKFPAKLDKVICLHASDGNGNKSGMDPSPRSCSDNLTTLGVAIPPISGESHLTGTSYSTPVAVGIAANVLRFVEHVTRAGFMNGDQRGEAFRRAGMKKILMAMSEDRDGYRFITPWRKMWAEGSMVEDIAWKIKQALSE